uniref:Uncharacterized protein n=1 Tax=Rhizophora mucronata TaxID=61149 RepID=A0A2P2Q4V2_RHIMU
MSFLCNHGNFGVDIQSNCNSMFFNLCLVTLIILICCCLIAVCQHK